MGKGTAKDSECQPFARRQEQEAGAGPRRRQQAVSREQQKWRVSDNVRAIVACFFAEVLRLCRRTVRKGSAFPRESHQNLFVEAAPRQVEA